MTQHVSTVPPFALARRVGHQLVELLRIELPVLADQVVEEIQEGVPAYADRRTTRRIRVTALAGIDLLICALADGEPISEQELRAFQGLAQDEYLHGRGINALQSAYRIGARAIWRRFSEIGQRAGVPPEEMYGFAEALFVGAEAVSTYSVQAYEQLRTGSLESLRRRLLELLVSDPGETSATAIRGLASQADWQLPETVACIAIENDRGERGHIGPIIRENALADLDRTDPFVLLQDPGRPGRMEWLTCALSGMRFAVGPTVPLAEASLSLSMAKNALSLVRYGMVPDQRHIRCEDHIPDLLLFGSDGILRILARRGFGSLPDLTAGQRERLSQTLLAWLTTGGSVPGTAARLMIHPQTVRYRMRQLEEIFGDLLHDHDWRFEMQLVLRAELLVRSADR